MLKRYLTKTNLLSTLLVGVIATSNFWKDIFHDFCWWFVVVAGGAAIIANILLLGRSESFKTRRQEYFLNYICESLFQEVRLFDNSFRINIMVRAITWHRGFPHRGLIYIKRYGFSESMPDNRLKILRGQGVAGNALKEELWAIGRRDTNNIRLEDGKVIPDINHGMDDKQRSMCSPLQMICSFPFRKLRQQGMEVEAGGCILGVVNIDSEKTAAEWERAGRLTPLLQQTLPNLAKFVGFTLG